MWEPIMQIMNNLLQASSTHITRWCCASQRKDLNVKKRNGNQQLGEHMDGADY